MVSQKKPVWEQRWEALNQEIASLNDSLGAIEVYPARFFARLTTIRCMLVNLQAFAEFHFSFFRDGFVQALEQDPENPPEHVYWIALDQIATDLAVIQQAAWQRAFGTQKMQETLKLADWLAQQALDPAKIYLSENNAAALTYFQKHPNIRVIPYAPAALIGIPFTSTLLTQDLLAIPHEVGHYIYWHGRPTINNPEKNTFREILDARIPANPAYAYGWKEEIFADVFGCLTARALIARSSQDLEHVYNLDAFYSDDGEHPSSLIRPHIYTKVLAARNDPNASRLDRLWLDYCKQRAGDHKAAKPGLKAADKNSFQLSNGFKIGLNNALGFASSNGFSKLDASRPVDRIIKESLTLLDDLQPGWWAASTPLTIQAPVTGQPDDTSELYDQFEARLAELSVLPDSDDLRSDDPYPSLWKSRYPDLQKTKKVSVAEWRSLMGFDGWASKGPTGNPRSK